MKKISAFKKLLSIKNFSMLYREYLLININFLYARTKYQFTRLYLKRWWILQ